MVMECLEAMRNKNSAILAVGSLRVMETPRPVDRTEDPEWLELTGLIGAALGSLSPADQNRVCKLIGFDWLSDDEMGV